MPSVSFSVQDEGTVSFSSPYEGTVSISLTSGDPVKSPLIEESFLTFFSNSTGFVEISNRTTWPLGDGYIVNGFQPTLVLDFNNGIYRDQKVSP